ncbi:hypothetical protein BDQ12DRAFT_674218 [Crucibulum laeve]|uniref:Uncharacterized protein n=1 Tax=Crucibulum laeve TaxID=68775 RepID=A0A5C3MMF2_9AGAR|nr:hypothetical protein BDQ12DRAFT_674218 [Crucibulum laeve]
MFVFRLISIPTFTMPLILLPAFYCHSYRSRTFVLRITMVPSDGMSTASIYACPAVESTTYGVLATRIWSCRPFSVYWEFFSPG